MMKPLGFVKDHRKKENNEYRDMAVLARTNAQLTILQTVMSKNMIPYDVVNGVMFTELPEIKLLISYLKLALHEGDNSAFSYVYNKPNRWLDQKFFAEVKENATRKNTSLYNAMFTIDRRNWRFKNGIDQLYEVINTLQNRKFESVGKMIEYLRFYLKSMILLARVNRLMMVDFRNRLKIWMLFRILQKSILI